MAMFSSARLALRQSLVAAPRAVSIVGALQQATDGPSSRRILHGQLLPRLFSSDAFGSDTNKHFPPSRYEVDANLELECKTRHEEKRKELIRLLIKALDTCEPAHRDRVMEKHEEVEQIRQEFLARAKANGEKAHNTDKGATRSQTAAGGKSWNLGDLVWITALSALLGYALSEMESQVE